MIKALLLALALGGQLVDQGAPGNQGPWPVYFATLPDGGGGGGGGSAPLWCDAGAGNISPCPDANIIQPDALIVDGGATINNNLTVIGNAYTTNNLIADGGVCFHDHTCQATAAGSSTQVQSFSGLTAAGSTPAFNQILGSIAQAANKGVTYTHGRLDFVCLVNGTNGTGSTYTMKAGDATSGSFLSSATISCVCTPGTANAVSASGLTWPDSDQYQMVYNNSNGCGTYPYVIYTLTMWN